MEHSKQTKKPATLMGWVSASNVNISNNSTLNHDLFSRNCVFSPACPHCNTAVEDVKHFFCTVQCMLLIVLLYLPLLPTFWEINGFWLRTRKRLNVFCLVLRVCNFSQMFVYSSKFSHLFLIHLVFVSLPL